MIATLGKWELWTDQPKSSKSDVAQKALQADLPELEQEAGDFIARQVLEKDSAFFGG